MKELIGKTCIVEKISDNAFNGNHPNGINVGYTVEGVVEMVDPYILISKETGGYFHTSAGIAYKKLDEGIYTVHTLNSTYSVKVK